MIILKEIRPHLPAYSFLMSLDIKARFLSMFGVVSGSLCLATLTIQASRHRAFAYAFSSAGRLPLPLLWLTHTHWDINSNRFLS